MGWFFGCFGSSRKKARNSSNRSRHGAAPPDKKSAPFALASPSPSIPIKRPFSKDHTIRSKEVYPERRFPQSAPVARAELDNVIRHQGKKAETKNANKDPRSQIDELEEELDNLRKKIEKENCESKKLKQEALSCKSPSLTQSEIECKRKRSDNVSVKIADTVRQTIVHQSRIPSAAPPISPLLVRQQESKQKAAEDGSVGVAADRSVVQRTSVLVNEKHFRTRAREDSRSGIAVVLDNDLELSRWKQTAVSNEVTKRRGDNVTTRVNCTESRMISAVVSGYGDQDAKVRNTSSSPYPKHRYDIDDTSSALYSLSMSMSDADDRNYEEDSGTFASSSSYNDDGALGLSRLMKVKQNQAKASCEEDRRRIITHDDDVHQKPCSEARNKVRRGRYDQVVSEDDDDPFADAMDSDEGEAADLVEPGEGFVNCDGGGVGEEQVAIEDAAGRACNRATRVRSKPASPVLTPVENLFQWKGLKERERKGWAEKVEVNGMRGARETNYEEDENRGMLLLSCRSSRGNNNKRMEVNAMEGRRGNRETHYEEGDRGNAMLLSSSRSSSSSNNNNNNRVDVSLCEWGVRGSIAVDASLSGWLPSPHRSSVVVNNIDSSSSSVGAWAAVPGTLPARPDASFSHWATPLPRQDAVYPLKHTSSSPSSATAAAALS